VSRDEWDEEEPVDDRPPICPACGVTMGLLVEGDTVRHVCLECGFDEAA
jgi:ribosomal protein S27AE